MLTWQTPDTELAQNQDIRNFRVERRRDDLADIDANWHIRAWKIHTNNAHYLDLFAGTGDLWKWHYRVCCVDWQGNESAWAYKTEGDYSPVICLKKANLILGILIWWKRHDADHHYRIFRREGWKNRFLPSNPVREDDLLVDNWENTMFFNHSGSYEANSDITRDFTLGKYYSYAVRGVSNSGEESLNDAYIDGEGGRVRPDDLDPVPEDKIISSTGWIFDGLQERIRVLDLKGHISEISISPQNITLDSDGTIDLVAGQAINIGAQDGNTPAAKINVYGDLDIKEKGDINFDSGNIFSGSSYIYIYPKSTPGLPSKALALGTTGGTGLYVWKSIKMAATNISLETQGFSNSQIYMWLPAPHYSGWDKKYRYKLYVGPDYDVRAALA